MVRVPDVARSFGHSEVLSGVGVVDREWREFRNGARTDGLRLSHWAKAGTDSDAGRWGPQGYIFWSLTLPPRLPL